MELHIDMSEKYYNKKDIGIACLDVKSGKHAGLAINKLQLIQIKKHLFKCKNYSKLHAICISILINEFDINSINSIYICNDEDFENVKKYLIKLINISPEKILSISTYRIDKVKTGAKIISPADSLASKYRKRALNPRRHHKGKKLNIINISYIFIQSKLKILDNPD